MNGWKQPIENLEGYFGDDYVALLIWERLLLRARSSDETRATEFAGKLHFLERGQCVFGDQELASMLGRDRKTIRNALKRLNKTYNKVDIKRTPKGSIATIKNYDEIVSMGQQRGQQKGHLRNNSGTTKGQQKDTNKNEESEESVKSEYIHSSDEVTGAKVNELLSKFSGINPSYKTLYANKTQRAALARMIKEHGEDEITKLLDVLPQVVQRKYAPRITNPLQLESRFGELVIFMKQEKEGGVFRVVRTK